MNMNEIYCTYCAQIVDLSDEWISVKDRLPEPYIPVLIYLGQRRIKIGVRQSDEYTHWMPLPPPPENKNE